MSEKSQKQTYLLVFITLKYFSPRLSYDISLIHVQWHDTFYKMLSVKFFLIIQIYFYILISITESKIVFTLT